MPYRRIAVIAAVTAVLLAAAPVRAETAHTADLVLSEGSGTCEALGVPVDAAPPATVVLEADEVALECSGSIDFRLGEDAAIGFDDASGTATADVLRIVGAKFGFTCGYEATEVVFAREGDSRAYSGGPYTGRKVQGSFLCPRSVQLDAAALVFG